jgi:hypothetical protein
MKNLTSLLVLSLFYIPVSANPGSGSDGSDITPKKKSPQIKVAQLKAPPLCPEANAGSDVSTACGGSSAIGTTNNINYHYSWYPATGLSSSTVYNPVASPGATTTYTLTMTPKTNMLVNGDFENGNTGFSSDYSYPLTSGTSVYTVGSSASAIYSWWCGTSPTSPNNMLIADGSISNGQRVWYQTITVQPSSNYSFSGKFLNLYSTIGYNDNDPNIRIEINGTTIASQTLAFNSCVWETISGSWTSGSGVTTATIAIYADPRVADWVGNDLAIDDLVLAPLCPQTTDDVTVTVTPPTITTEPYIQEFVDMGLVTIHPNYDMSICLLYGSPSRGGVYVNLISSQTGNLQWYKDGVPIPGATSQTLTRAYGFMPFANPTIELYQVTGDCGVSDVRTVTSTIIPYGPGTGQITTTSVELTDRIQPPHFPSSYIDPNFHISFTVSSPGQITQSSSSSAITTTVSVPASFPTTVTVYPVYHNFGCSVPGNDRTITFYGNLSPLIVWGKETARSHSSTILRENSEPGNLVQVAPNPARDHILVSSAKTFRKVQLYDANGAMRVLYNKPGTRARLDVSALQTGIYFVTVIFDNGIKTERVIIAK